MNTNSRSNDHAVPPSKFFLLRKRRRASLSQSSRRQPIVNSMAPILLASILVLLGTMIPTHAFAPPPSTAKSHTTHSPCRHSADRLTKQRLLTHRRESLSLLRSTVVATTTVSTVSLPHTEFYPSDSTDSTPVVFLHGLLGSKRNFASLAKSLGTQLDTKRRIVGVDLRNHGMLLLHYISCLLPLWGVECVY